MTKRHTYFISIFSLVFVIVTVLYPLTAWGAESKLRPVPESLAHELEPTPDLKDKPSLSLEEAMELAYKYNPDLRSAELQLDRAEILRDLAADSITFLPTGDMLVTPEGRVVVNSYEQADINWKSAKKAAESKKQEIEKSVIDAYASALKAYNQMELIKLQQQELEAQNKLHQLATANGIFANLDLRTSQLGMEQMESRLKACEASYQLALSQLRSLLNQSPDWQPVLVSKPIANEVECDELWLEISRGENQSIMMLQATAALELEESKLYWGLGSSEEDPYLDKINLYLKQLNVEQAKKDTRNTVEQLYHSIEALEKQISQKNIALQQKEQELQTAKLKYEVGVIPYRSLTGTESLASAELAYKQAVKELESLRIDLVTLRANFGYITGQQVYSKLDWAQVEDN